MKQKSTSKLLLTASVLLFGWQTSFAQYDSAPFNDMPPMPSEYGKCYAKCRIPERYESAQTQVLVKEASSKRIVKPAAYETVSEQVLVKEASKKLIPVPAEYETVSEQVLIKEASTKLIETAPRYETRTERVLVSDAYGKWVRKKKGPSCLSANPDDCYIMCWEEVPAQYKNISKQVLVSSGESRSVEIPAEYRTVTRRVLKTPATVREVEIPAEYKTITRKVLSHPATTEEISIPAEYKTVTERRLVEQGGYTRWTEVVCDKDMTDSYISRVQRALKDRGYDPGVIDGVMGGRTKAALEKFQQDNNLPVGNLNKETTNALGV